MSISIEAIRRPHESGDSLAGALDLVISALATYELGVTNEAIAAILSHVTRCYVHRLQQGAYFSPFSSDVEITATEAMILSTEVLKTADLQLFELGMWQAMGSPT